VPASEGSLNKRNKWGESNYSSKLKILAASPISSKLINSEGWIWRDPRPSQGCYKTSKELRRLDGFF
jgi:hypothetical protein